VTSDTVSAAGVEQRGRNGITAVTVSALFLAALFFSVVDALLLGYFVVRRSRL
jgi:xanthine/uracil/vitamin C permease (AzgA family)